MSKGWWAYKNKHGLINAPKVNTGFIGTTYYTRAYAVKSNDWTAYGNCVKSVAGSKDITELENMNANFTVYPNPNTG